MPKLLIVDDEPNVLYSLKKCLETESLQIVTAATGETGIGAVSEHRPDAVILDVRLPDMSGLDAFSIIHEIDARIPVIIITAYSTTETAIEAMKRGAFEYLLKPVEFEKLLATVDSAIEISLMSRTPATFGISDGDDVSADQIVGRSTAMQEVYKSIGQVAPQDVNALILGESGTGKEMIARAIYQHSRRSDRPFLAINCAALPENLLESELFGHERGSFTGADRRRIGKFEQVNRGTIFLDEIGDMTPATQAKVLRLLQDGSLERVGSNETIKVDVRIIAATNRSLLEMVKDGDFREDLYYRLSVFVIQLPALRDRTDDIPVLVRHFVNLFSRAMDKQIRSIAPEAMARLEQYRWPGNVRELQSAIKHSLVRNVGEVLTVNSLPTAICGSEMGDSGEVTAKLDLANIRQHVSDRLRHDPTNLYHQLHSEVDRILLTETLNHVDGNQAQASEILGIARSTLRTKINDLGLRFEKRYTENP
ncbi:sigma-54-dependent transcriptional regulator [Novipirellula artificiosorum]|uniref:DNA-binding transcriptional regulator NtrC n=1 Tax=Novipirellula artificiosorum TaxID=2528016 RepID=A0A5C6D5M3_9BACT|nr:sigma-54 dependent transcriptional regulator [Novipirellula artificiosorum]TWU32453.1 Transcriptional regulatory protein ZraR [Novipirellula artificiosorum]